MGVAPGTESDGEGSEGGDEEVKEKEVTVQFDTAKVLGLALKKKPKGFIKSVSDTSAIRVSARILEER